MSSRFVSAGAIDPTTGEAAASSEQQPVSRTHDANKPDDEWLAVEKELAAERRRRDEARSAAATGREPSLFEILQANKEAKQAAFEEANKIKNQFRTLDDDEVDFLDEVKARQREEEDRVRRETEERVAAFRAAQKTNEQRTGDDDNGEEEGTEEWVASAGRKRKRVERKGVGLVKRRTVSASDGEKVRFTGEKKEGEKSEERKEEEKNKKGEAENTASVPTPTPAVMAKPRKGLVSYDSDSDDD